MKKPTLRQIASRKSGKERYCQKCEFRTGKLCRYLDICDAAFRRGFIKGYEYHRDMNKPKMKQL